MFCLPKTALASDLESNAYASVRVSKTHKGPLPPLRGKGGPGRKTKVTNEGS